MRGGQVDPAAARPLVPDALRVAQRRSVGRLVDGQAVQPRPADGAAARPGSCACGKCAFEAPSGLPDAALLLQSVPAALEDRRPDVGACEGLTGWRWTRDETLKLIRTTGHGSGHMCRKCGTTLTIVYDNQPDCLWPVAGVIDDDSLPEDMGGVRSAALFTSAAA